MSPLDWLLEGTLTVGGSAILVREVVGNGFGLASAVGGMRRRVWAWPVGIVGNLVLFTVFVGGILDKPQVEDLWGQAGPGRHDRAAVGGLARAAGPSSRSSPSSGPRSSSSCSGRSAPGARCPTPGS